MKAARQRFQRNLELARQLGPLVSRGVLQHFFVSPLLPLRPMSPDEIAASWSRLAANIRSGDCPELLTLYLHIPFCTHKCRYCIYHSVGDFQSAALEAYLSRLHDEIAFYAPLFQGLRFATCYLGGGTPTVLTESQLAGLLDRIDQSFGRRRGGEWAFECNPLTLNEKKARLFEQHGFNRVSFGVQTLNAQVLEQVNRGYQTRQSVESAFRVLQDCRFWINVDLIYGLPGDNLESMKLSLERILDFNPNQVTIYALSPYTPLPAGRQETLSLEKLAEALQPVADGFRRSIGIHSTCLDVSSLEHTRDRLTEEYEAAGEEFAYDDTTVEPFSLLGLGPTARSYVYAQLSYVFDAYDTQLPFDPQAPCARGRTVSKNEEMRRYVTHRLVTPSGVDSAGFKQRFGKTLKQAFGKEIRALQALHLLKEKDGLLMHASRDEFERFATELFFVDQTMLKAARLQVTEAGEETGTDSVAASLELEAQGTSLKVVLADYWPGRACFHHAGKFAFFTPQSGELGELEERLLRAFSRLFERIIEREKPESVAALKEALFKRGQNLRLSIKAGDRTEHLTVRLTGFD